MHLFLVRHGETEHNILGLLAGVTDSRLTNHGLLQAQRLGIHLATTRKLRLTHIFASDLQRAWLTAGQLREGQHRQFKDDATQLPEVVKLDLLREQDFGSLEMTAWASREAFNSHDARSDPEFRHKETTESMVTRADQFVADFLAPLWALGDEDQCVAVVSHGLFLFTLWKVLVNQFDVRRIQLSPEVEPVMGGRSADYMIPWSNTAFLEVEINAATEEPEMPSTIPDEVAPSLPLTLRIVTVNGQHHLQNLKRTRGGVGSAAYDTRQKQIDGFFKRPEPDDDAVPN